MGTGIALFIYYAAAVVALAIALHLWRDLSLSPLRRKLTSAATEKARLLAAAATEKAQLLSTAETERNELIQTAASERTQWAHEIQHVREHVERLRHELEQVRHVAATRWAAYDRMQDLWACTDDDPATEAEAKELLRENMWVLEPEYRLIDERIEWESNLSNTLYELYGDLPETDDRVWRTPPNQSLLVDIAAVVSMEGALGTPRTHAGDEALLLIEAKRPGRNGVLDEAAREQVLTYAADLRKLAPEMLMGRRIECLLIGGRIPDRMNDVVVKWDSEGEAPTHVRFLTWETLLRRAERACQAAGPRPNHHLSLEPLPIAAQ